MSGRALGWAKEQAAPSREAKAALVFLADYASAAGFAWPSIAALAGELGCSDRTVIRHLKALVEASLLVRLDVEDRMTGRTRPCAYWFPMAGRAPSAGEVAAYEAEVGGRVTLVSPWEGDSAVTLEGDTDVRGRVTTVSPLEPLLEPSEPEGSSPGAREAVPAGLVGEIEAAMPRTMTAVSSRPAYLEALAVLAADGVDLGVLPGCLRRLGADRLFTGLRVPPRLETWLLDGKWRAYLAEGGEGIADATAAEGEPVPEALVAAVRPFARDGELGSYLQPARLRAAGGRVFLVARTGVGRDWIRGHWARIEAAWDGGAPGLALVSRAEFEALARAEGQTEGKGGG